MYTADDLLSMYNKQHGITADPWVVVGRTTIDGTFEQVREAFGGPWENVDDLQYALAIGDVFDVGGRSLRVEAKEVHDNKTIVACDIVRRQSEIDAEVASEHLRHDHVIAQEYPSTTCPECSPHGNDGRVLLASTWVACTVCAGGRPGDAFGAVVEASTFDPNKITVEIKMIDKASEKLRLAGFGNDVGFVVPTAREANAALSASLVAEGASIEAGVQAIVAALSAPCERRTRIGGHCSSETPCPRCERCT